MNCAAGRPSCARRALRAFLDFKATHLTAKLDILAACTFEMFASRFLGSSVRVGVGGSAAITQLGRHLSLWSRKLNDLVFQYALGGHIFLPLVVIHTQIFMEKWK